MIYLELGGGEKFQLLKLGVAFKMINDLALADANFIGTPTLPPPPNIAVLLTRRNPPLAPPGTPPAHVLSPRFAPLGLPRSLASLSSILLLLARLRHDLLLLLLLQQQPVMRVGYISSSSSSSSSVCCCCKQGRNLLELKTRINCCWCSLCFLQQAGRVKEVLDSCFRTEHVQINCDYRMHVEIQTSSTAESCGRQDHDGCIIYFCS
jgi:hypothetical protein